MNKYKSTNAVLSSDSDKNEKSNPDNVLDLIFHLHPLWSFKNYDFGHVKWTLKVPEKFIVALQIMSGYENEPWGKMKQGLVSIEDTLLNNEAIERIGILGLDKLDYYHGCVFSLYLLGEERLWGIPREDGVFSIIWWDLDLEVL
ncbi:MAG: hypothetical protein LBT59_24100 [Clostridiales bacterium]|jgi:hypothetical protein|nr:hypothetical protein [Clostridiales bacterium]